MSLFLVAWKHLPGRSWINHYSGCCAFSLGAGWSVGAPGKKAGMLTLAQGYMQTEEKRGRNVRVFLKFFHLHTHA